MVRIRPLGKYKFRKPSCPKFQKLPWPAKVQNRVSAKLEVQNSRARKVQKQLVPKSEVQNESAQEDEVAQIVAQTVALVVAKKVPSELF